MQWKFTERAKDYKEYNKERIFYSLNFLSMQFSVDFLNILTRGYYTHDGRRKIITRSYALKEKQIGLLNQLFKLYERCLTYHLTNWISVFMRKFKFIQISILLLLLCIESYKIYILYIK